MAGPWNGSSATGLALLTPESTGWSLGGVDEIVESGSITTMAYVIWDMATRKGNLLLKGPAPTLPALLSTPVSRAYLGDTPNPKLWAGRALLVAGALLSWVSVAARAKVSKAVGGAGEQGGA